MIGPARRFADLTTAEVPHAVTSESIMVLPLGAIEPHGPHLPLATDLVMAESVAAKAVRRAAAGDGAGSDVWLLPSIGYTKSNEHARLPGTMWISTSTLYDTVMDIGTSVAETPAKTLVFVNGHGGNSSLLDVLLRDLRHHHDLRTFLVSSPPTPGESERGIGVHAGWSETSMMLHLDPELVDMDAAADLGPQVAHSVADCTHIGFGGPVKFGWLSTDLSPSGVVGDPTGASAAAGERLVEEYISSIVEALPDIATFNPGAL